MVALIGGAMVLGLAANRVALRPGMAALVEFERPEQKPEPPKVRPRPLTASAPKGAPSPRNLHNRATPVAAPLLTPLIIPPPLTAAPRPATGAASNTGASDRVGPGQGAGGLGDGLGGGGHGGDGDGAGETAPRQVKGRLKFSDLPADLQVSETGRTVSVRYYVYPDGKVGGCSVTASSGSAELDSLTCRLIEQRFRFRPSRDAIGQPVRSIIAETHRWSIERDEAGA